VAEVLAVVVAAAAINETGLFAGPRQFKSAKHSADSWSVLHFDSTFACAMTPRLTFVLLSREPGVEERIRDGRLVV
jgi:hypothetical protein